MMSLKANERWRWAATKLLRSILDPAGNGVLVTKKLKNTCIKLPPLTSWFCREYPLLAFSVRVRRWGIPSDTVLKHQASISHEQRIMMGWLERKQWLQYMWFYNESINTENLEDFWNWDETMLPMSCLYILTWKCVCVCFNQRNTFRIWFSSFSMCIPGINFGSPSFVANSLTWGSISLSSYNCIFERYSA